MQPCPNVIPLRPHLMPQPEIAVSYFTPSVYVEISIHPLLRSVLFRECTTLVLVFNLIDPTTERKTVPVNVKFERDYLLSNSEYYLCRF